MTEPAPPVLRVLNGRLAGTEKPLPHGTPISIGHQFWQDIVIRDPATRGIALDLTIQEDGSACLSVLTGEATLLGSTLGEGRVAPLPPYVPFTIGGVALAWGDAESARWSDASGLATAIAPVAAPVPTIGDQATAMAEVAGKRVVEALRGWRLAALGGAATLLVAATAAGPAMTAMGLTGTRADKVEQALGKAGLPELKATESSAAGAVIVSGVVGGEGERAKAEQVLRSSRVPAQLDVQTSNELAQASADVARLTGLEATARPVGRTIVELRTTPLSPDQREKLLHAVRSDVQSVKQVVLRDDLVPTDNAPVRSLADATKKVSTVVAGDPAYIQTSDGTVYFAGAMMPSGHKLKGIEGQTVLLEKNGRETRLTF